MVGTFGLSIRDIGNGTRIVLPPEIAHVVEIGNTIVCYKHPIGVGGTPDRTPIAAGCPQGYPCPPIECFFTVSISWQ